MSRSIESYPESQRAAVVKRRAIEQRGGLGYWAAIDAQRKLAKLTHLREQQQRRDEDGAAA